MTRSIRIITVVGVALVLVPSAFAKGQPVDESTSGQSTPIVVGERFQEAPQWYQALQARSEGMNAKYLPDRSTPIVVGERFQESPQSLQALELRSEGMNKAYGLGEYAVNGVEAREKSQTAKYDAQLVSTPAPDWFERAATAAIRDNRGVYVADDRFDLHPQTVPTTVAATSSGREIDFPQIGIGLGIALLLALGLVLVMRATHNRPVPH